MKTSDRGVELVKKVEGLVLHVYKDSAGLATVGYGHLLTQAEAKGKVFTTGFTEAQATDLLRADLGLAETAVNELVKVPLTQNQFDALVCFVFNVGHGAFAGSTALKKLNAKDYQSVPRALALWNKITDPKTGAKVVSKGLESRRAAEIKLWNAI